MNIGTDLDGVIADSDPVYRFFIKKFLGQELKRKDVTSFFYEDCLGITIDKMNKVWEFFNREQGWNKIKPVVGAIKYLNKFATKNKIFVVSSRPVFLEKITRRWLDRYKVNYDKLILTDSQPKLKIIKDLNITYFIEDRLDYAQEMAKAGIKVLLLDYPWNQSDEEQANLYRVKNWDEVDEFFRIQKHTM
ncbi:MAG: hypothetical protein AB1349_03610 [Elusimicrobiota bacterium]